jgi:hypothetical protein
VSETSGILARTHQRLMSPTRNVSLAGVVLIMDCAFREDL